MEQVQTKFAFLHVKVCWCFDEGPRLRFPSKALNVDYRNSAADLDTRNTFFHFTRGHGPGTGSAGLCGLNVVKPFIHALLLNTFVLQICFKLQMSLRTSSKRKLKINHRVKR